MELLEFTMTGTRHSEAYNTHKHDIKEGDTLTLVWDKGNAYDTDAIKVLWQDMHIGWVPKRLAEAKTMLRKLVAWENAPFTFLIEVSTHEPENPVDMQLVVSVKLLEYEE